MYLYLDDEGNALLLSIYCSYNLVKIWTLFVFCFCYHYQQGMSGFKFLQWLATMAYTYRGACSTRDLLLLFSVFLLYPQLPTIPACLCPGPSQYFQYFCLFPRSTLLLFIMQNRLIFFFCSRVKGVLFCNDQLQP